jgi:two-component system, NtrC family, sensor histidine kinase PilS
LNPLILKRKWLGVRATGVGGEALQSLMLARSGVLYVLLALGVLSQLFQGSGSSPLLVTAYGFLSLGFAFNFLASLVPEKEELQSHLSVVHIVFDVLLISFWVSFSGGKESLYALLYLVHILFVALILYQRAALFAASASVIAFGLTLYWQATESIWLVWGMNSALFVTLGLVGGYLSEELHRAGIKLAEKNKKIEDLISLQERILSHMPTGLLAVDAGMRVGFINPAAAALLRLVPEEVSGRPLSEVAKGIIPFFRDEVAEPHTSRLQQVVEVEVHGQRKILRGDIAMLREGEALGALLHGEANEGSVLLFQDVTNQLQLEEKLRQNEKLAAVGQLAAGIAHEIRNPLAGMSASIEMLRSSLPPEVVAGENHKLMEIALREIDRLNRLISEFLDYVKPQQQKIESVDLRKVISDIVFSLKHPQHPGKIQSLKGGISVRTDIELKEVYQDGVSALANAEKMKQVVWNLVINAIQSMDKAGSIEVGCDLLAPDKVKFWVRDQGQGMSEKTLAHLYEPFFTTKEKGTGLGLATVYKLVESFQGEIRVQSHPGTGTLFEVVLPKA